jgi:hypothetical protein
MNALFVLVLPSGNRGALDQFVVVVWERPGITAVSAGHCSFRHESPVSSRQN